MTLEAWFTIGIIALVIAALVTNKISADVAMVGGLTLLMVGDFVLVRLFETGPVVSVPAAIKGFAHPAVLMVGSLFVVAQGLQETAAMEPIARKLLGRPRSVAMAQLRLMAQVAPMSAFMNNTPIVAMYLPMVMDWARKLKISPSKLLMPLSFSAILGGKLTYIGTSTNVVVLAMYVAAWGDAASRGWMEQAGTSPLSTTMQFWGVGLVGLPTAVVGIAFIMVASRWLLPERKPADPIVNDARRYQVEMVVKADSPIVGKTIEAAGLRNLPGLYLNRIERDDRILHAVGPDEVIRAGDRLAFAGILESVVDLRRIRGLEPATDQVEKVEADWRLRTFVEAVVSRTSPLVGRTVKGSRFRTVYNAAIIAVYRDGQPVHRKIGDIVLQPGDTLLLDTHGHFVEAYRNSGDFYLISPVEGSRPVRHERSWLALAILACLVGLLTLTPISPVLATMLCALAMVGTRCVTGTVARTAINWQVLLVIGAALGIGEALTQTGAAHQIAHGLLVAARGVGLGDSPTGMLLVIVLSGALFSQFITPYGAAVLMFPITMATAQDLGVRPEAFVFGLIVAVGSSYMSPVAYQTNLMVYGPGGYTFMDFVRLGTPLTILVAIVATAVAAFVFPF
jgi:di/tricarboxylate transporter